MLVARCPSEKQELVDLHSTRWFLISTAVKFTNNKPYFKLKAVCDALICHLLLPVAFLLPRLDDVIFI